MGRYIGDLGRYLFATFVAGAWWKAVLSGIAGFASFILPDQAKQEGAMTVGLLVLIDTVTGILAAKREGHKITSEGFSRTVSKGIVYACLVITASVAAKSLFGAGDKRDFVIGAALTWLTLTEAKSILENAKRLGFNIKWLTRIVKDGLDSAGKEDKP